MLSTGIIRDRSKLKEYCRNIYQFRDALASDDRKILCAIYNLQNSPVVWHDVHAAISVWVQPDIGRLSDDEIIEFCVCDCLLDSDAMLNYINGAIGGDIKRVQKMPEVSTLSVALFKTVDSGMKKALRSIQQSLLVEAMFLMGHIYNSSIRRDVCNQMLAHLRDNVDEDFVRDDVDEHIVRDCIAKCEQYLTPWELGEFRKLRISPPRVSPLPDRYEVV